MRPSRVPARAVSLVIDDAGSHAAIDEAVRMCIESGTVDGVSILGSAPDAARACGLVSGSAAGVAVHLNAVEAPLLTMEPLSIPALLLRAGKVLDDVEREWRAQIERVLSLGAVVSRLDSHRHVHNLPGYSSLAIRLALEYGAGRIRAAILPDPSARPSGPILHLLGRRLAREALSAGLYTPACMAGFGASGHMSRSYLERLRLPPGECEVVAHPATEKVWSDGQPSELELILSEWFRRWKTER